MPGLPRLEPGEIAALEVGKDLVGEAGVDVCFGGVSGIAHGLVPLDGGPRDCSRCASAHDSGQGKDASPLPTCNGGQNRKPLCAFSAQAALSILGACDRSPLA